jgi:hypothetical protein
MPGEWKTGAVAVDGLFLREWRTFLWYQGRSRVVPG